MVSECLPPTWLLHAWPIAWGIKHAPGSALLEDREKNYLANLCYFCWFAYGIRSYLHSLTTSVIEVPHIKTYLCIKGACSFFKNRFESEYCRAWKLNVWRRIPELYPLIIFLCTQNYPYYVDIFSFSLTLLILLVAWVVIIMHSTSMRMRMVATNGI